MTRTSLIALLTLLLSACANNSADTTHVGTAPDTENTENSQDVEEGEGDTTTSEEVRDDAAASSGQSDSSQADTSADEDSEPSEQDSSGLDSAEEDTTSPDSEDLDSAEEDGAEEDSEDLDSAEEDGAEEDGAVDVGPEADTVSEDTEVDPGPEEDTASEDTEVDPGPEDTISVEFTSPDYGSVILADEGLLARVQIQDTEHDVASAQLEWSGSALNGATIAGEVQGDGSAEIRFEELLTGPRTLTAWVSNEDGDLDFANLRLTVCDWSEPETFDGDDLGDWVIARDAYIDPAGWLEMTGASTFKAGIIYNPNTFYPPGALDVRFRILTGNGGGMTDGADGFAVSFYAAPDTDTLATWLDEAKDGGCFAFGLTGQCGVFAGTTYTSEDIPAFHIEFDTYYNGDRDPTPNDHVGIMLNGDAFTHHAWADLGNIEDALWHDVEVRVDGTQVVVRFDDDEVLNTEIPLLDFKGGYIAFSGATGGDYNEHRFDDLSFLNQCEAP